MLARECPIIQKFQFFNQQFGIGSTENPRQVPQFWLKAQKNQAMALGIRPVTNQDINEFPRLSPIRIDRALDDFIKFNFGVCARNYFQQLLAGTSHRILVIISKFYYHVFCLILSVELR